MLSLIQSPTAPEFVQNPYPFYAKARSQGPLHFWQDYDMPAAFSYDLVNAVLRDRRFGREIPSELARPGPAHLAPFLALESHSMLDAEPPRHTRLRALVMRAFTSRAIKALTGDLTTLSYQLIDAFPKDSFDLIGAFCNQIPVITIARLLGVPDHCAPDLLAWSHAMVAMYMANRTRAVEDAAAQASAEFTEFLRAHIETHRATPRDDLITQLIAAEQDGSQLSTDELISTVILLLNAGHEATVHSLANGVKTLLETGSDLSCLEPDQIAATVNELLRFDPPLHMFTRYAYENLTLAGHSFQRGDQIALLLGAANRDPAIWSHPNQFDPTRPAQTHTSFGGGLHFCVGAPLARLELEIALPILFNRCPNLRLTSPPTYANSYHFHGLTQLWVAR
ncbi:MAG: cytochrome P450 [Sedimentitalea sp.]